MTRTTMLRADPVKARDAFNTQRLGYFGASLAAVLFDKHPFTTAADEWIHKFNETMPDETTDMIRGQELEPAIASWYARDRGISITKADQMHTWAHMAANPDYFTADHIPIEIKSTKTYTDDGAPLDYWVYQVQAQMGVLGDEAHPTHAIIAWIDGRFQLYSTTIERDQATIDQIYARSEDFMSSLDTGIMPDWVERSARHIIAQYPDPSNNLELGDQAYELAANYWQHKKAMKYHEEAAAALRDEAFLLAQNHEALTRNGEEIITLRPKKMPARLDKAKVEAFAAEHGVHINAFMTEATNTRVINVPKKIRTMIEAE